MLFTRCPDCQTNFRITADALRKADGQVRCGYCSAVFNAYEELRDGNGSEQTPSPVEESAEKEFDSLSETDEYFTLQGDRPTEAATEPVSREAAAEEGDVEDTPPVEPVAEDEGPIVEEEAGSLPSRESTLEFDLPPDEWTTFFQHAVEHPLAENLPQGGGAAQPAAEDPTEPQDGEHSIEDIVIKEIADDIDEAEDDDAALDVDSTEDGVSRVIRVPESDEAVAQLAEAIAPDSDRASETSLVIEEIVSPEDAEATSSEEDEVVADVMAIDGVAEESRSWKLLESRRWSVGSALFLALLLAQFVHHFRAPLAGQRVVGPLVQAGYSLAGAEIVPDWDLAQYEIMDWVATADADTGEPGSLHISARIRNRGPRAQPYPSVRLELKDRWEATVGSRVFTAAEYLPKDVPHEQIMDAGTTVPASLEVVDPGQDAYGFELDICAELDGGGLRCASDSVFQ